MAHGVVVGTKEWPSIEQRNDHEAMGTFSMRQRKLPLGAFLGEATRILTLIAARQERACLMNVRQFGVSKGTWVPQKTQKLVGRLAYLAAIAEYSLGVSGGSIFFGSGILFSFDPRQLPTPQLVP